MKNSFQTVKVNKIINDFDHADGGWCWTKYGAGPYVGCSYDCVYCYNLGLDDQSAVKIKEDAIDKFRRELKPLPKDVVTLGDYQPAETELRLIRKMLNVVADLDFPIHIIEKSPLVTADLDLIKKVKDNSWAAVSMSVTGAPSQMGTAADLSRFEPRTPTPAERFAAMAEIASEGILTGTCCVPVIPLIGDSLENIEATISATKEAGGRYFLLGSLVLPEPFDQLFWDTLKKHFPDQVAKMRDLYHPNNSDNFSAYFGDLDRKTSRLCEKYGLLNHIPRPVDHYPQNLRLNKLVAEDFYLASRFGKANDLTVEEEYAYLAVAWLLDDLDYDITQSYRKKGLAAFAAFGLEDELAGEVETAIKKKM